MDWVDKFMNEAEEVSMKLTFKFASSVADASARKQIVNTGTVVNCAD